MKLNIAKNLVGSAMAGSVVDSMHMPPISLDFFLSQVKILPNMLKVVTA